VIVADRVSEGEGEGEGEWRFEAKLGQSVSLKLDAASVGLTDTFTDDVRLHMQAAAGLVSVNDSTTSSVHLCTRLKVSPLVILTLLLCLSVCLSVCVSVSLSLCLSVCLSVAVYSLALFGCCQQWVWFPVNN